MTKDEFVAKLIPLGNKMRRLANLLVSDDESAKDIVQEVYVKLWNKRSELDHCGNLTGYVIRAVRNACLDHLRKTRPGAGLPDDLVSRNYERDYEQTESGKIVKELIGKLPDQQRQTIELRDVAGYSFAEIAEALGLSVNHVRVNLSIARKKIREELLKIQNYGLKRN